jgi:integrase
VVVPVGVKRCQLRQFGHPTRASAAHALAEVQELLAIAQHADDPAKTRLEIAALVRSALATRQPLPDASDLRAKVAVGQPVNRVQILESFLREWIAGKDGLKPNTRRSYRQQIDEYLIPLLGHHRLDRLRTVHVQAAFKQIAEQSETITAENSARHRALAASKKAWHEHNAPAARAAREVPKQMPAYRRPAGPATIQRVRATLRAALNDACRQQLVTVNVAALAEPPSVRRCKPKVWTEARVKAWRSSGEVPGSVMVWTIEQARAFLACAREHRFYPLYLLIAHCGLRRGEAVGLRWQDVDFETGIIEIRQQIVQLGWQTETADTKTEAGERTVIAVPAVLAALADERAVQYRRRHAAGPAWLDTGLVFTTDTGSPLHPSQVTEQFHRLTEQADLPPTKLHSLRHGAATHALSAGVPLKTVSNMLGHSSYQITADTYAAVADDAKRDVAQTIAAQLADGADQAWFPSRDLNSPA